MVTHSERHRVVIDQVTKPLAFWIAVAFILMVFLMRDDFSRSTIRYTLQGAALAVIMAHILFAKRSDILRWALNLPPVVWIGRLSFSIYLLHSIMNHVAAHFLPWGPHDWQTWPFAVALTLLASWACYTVIEQPMIRIGKRFTVLRSFPA